MRNAKDILSEGVPTSTGNLDLTKQAVPCQVFSESWGCFVTEALARFLFKVMRQRCDDARACLDGPLLNLLPHLQDQHAASVIELAPISAGHLCPTKGA